VCGVSMIQYADGMSGCIGNALDSRRFSSVRLMVPMSHSNAHVVSVVAMMECTTGRSHYTS